jgi:hypothetical protein
MSLLPLKAPVNFAASLGCSAGSVAVDGVQSLLGNDIKPAPASMRTMLFSMEGAIHGRISDILGDDEAERVATIARFLSGTNEAEINELLGYIQLAIVQVNTNR